MGKTAAGNEDMMPQYQSLTPWDRSCHQYSTSWHQSSITWYQSLIYWYNLRYLVIKLKKHWYQSGILISVVTETLILISLMLILIKNRDIDLSIGISVSMSQYTSCDLDIKVLNSISWYQSWCLWCWSWYQSHYRCLNINVLILITWSGYQDIDLYIFIGILSHFLPWYLFWQIEIYLDIFTSTLISLHLYLEIYLHILMVLYFCILIFLNIFLSSPVSLFLYILVSFLMSWPWAGHSLSPHPHKGTHHPAWGIWSRGKRNSPPWWSSGRSSGRRAAPCGWWPGAWVGSGPGAQTSRRHGINPAWDG